MELKVELVFDREAKNTVRYLETMRPPRLYNSMLYIQKAAFGEGYPRELVLTIASKPRLGIVRSS